MSRLKCAACGAPQTDSANDAQCSRCGGLLVLEIDRPAASASELRQLFAMRGRGSGPGSAAGPERRELHPLSEGPERRDPPPPEDRSGVWRYRELVLPGATDPVTYPEGNTPLIERPSLTEWSGAGSLMVKHEGNNPTGSFKDRGMAVALTRARQTGATAVLCASTGNTSSSMVAYAAIAGIPAVVLVPAGNVAPAKLAQTVAYGATVLSVRGNFDDCLRLAREAAKSLGIYLANSINPFRLAGQKTTIFELLDQLGWNPPDWIALPAGNLGNASAFGAALEEAREIGLIGRVPRLLLVQAAGAAPFVASFRTGFAERVSVDPATVATAIRIGNPASFDRAVHSMRVTDGVAVSVTDAEILEAKRAIDRSGIGCEPASAAAVAGVRQLVRDGMIGASERVVAVLTGHLLKDIDAGGAASRPDALIEVEARITDVEEALRLR